MAVLMFFIARAYGQSVISLRDGYWDDPTIWSTGSVPDVFSDVTINHHINLRAPLPAKISGVLVAGHLILESGATLELNNPATSRMRVAGVLECAEGSLLVGATASNTRFEPASRYIHRQGPLGFIPMATWDVASTFQISGFADDGYINLAHSASWRQSFGNVEYDCPGQTVFVVDLNSHLRDIRGNFTVKNTNNKALRLCTTQQATINIGGSLSIEGTSQVWFSTNSANCTVNIGGDFQYKTTSGSGSYLTTRGNIRMVIARNWIIDSQSVLRMASSAADSTGSRQSWVSVGGDFLLSRGGLVAPPAGSGKGLIEFNGTALQRVSIGPVASPLVGNLEYSINLGSTVSLGESALVSDQGALTVNGTLQLGSTDVLGAIQSGRSGGNIRIPGVRTFGAQSTIVYKGTAPQTLSAAHPQPSRTILDNLTGFTLSAELTVGNDLTIEHGVINQAGHALTVGGNITIKTANARFDNIQLSGGRNQIIDANGAMLTKLVLVKSGGRVDLSGPLFITGGVDVSAGGVTFGANGLLTLVSTGDSGGRTARIGSLPAGSTVQGDVIVQRFMSAEGRLYRYISSPINTGTVASLMDDFPVTGWFADPSAGPGINPANPSLFEYDESLGEKLSGWKPYPQNVNAADASLRPGKGYAAFIRNQSATTLDFAGPINQGDITLSLSYTLHGGRPNGWHLVGNPYPAAISWESSALAKYALSNVIVVTDNGDRRFRYWDGDPQFSDLPDGRIALGQSFWVRATSGGSSLTFREGAKSEDASFYRRPVAPVPSLCVTISSGRLSDRAVLRLRRQSKDSLDAWDGAKLFNDTLNVAMTTDDDFSLAIDSRPALPDSIAITLSEIPEGRYSVRLSASDTLRDLTYYIRDNYLRQTTAISLSDSLEFMITADKESGRADRFTLLIRDTVRAHVKVPDATIDTSLLFVNHGVSTYGGLRDYQGETDDTVCLRAYPNPVVSDLIIEQCCESAKRSPGYLSPVERANQAPLEAAVYNAAGMRIESAMFSLDAGTERNRLSLRRHCRRYVLSLQRLPPGPYHLLLSSGRTTRWIRFVKM
ncbi:MAG: hypothetical protein QM762_07100 [Chryseolinea sp.]